MSIIIRGNGSNEVFAEACNVLLTDADYESAPRGMKIKELINATIEMDTPCARIITLPRRKLSLRYLAGELCFYFSGSTILENIAHYSKFWEKVSDDGIHVNSNYGKHLFWDVTGHNESQFEYCRDCLIQDKDSRKAVAFIYDPYLHSKESKDNPCTAYIQFIIRNDKLIMITNMRSNDLWFGFSYDMPFFTIVQEIMMIALRETYPDIRLGKYIHNAASLHLYERNWEPAKECAKDFANFAAVVEAQFMPEMKDKRSLTEIPMLLGYETALRNASDDVVPGRPRFETEFVNNIAAMLEKS